MKTSKKAYELYNMNCGISKLNRAREKRVWGKKKLPLNLFGLDIFFDKLG